MRVIGAGARLFVQPRNGFEIVIHHIWGRFTQDTESAVKAATEIWRKNFDAGSG